MPAFAILSRLSILKSLLYTVLIYIYERYIRLQISLIAVMFIYVEGTFAYDQLRAAMPLCRNDCVISINQNTSGSGMTIWYQFISVLIPRLSYKSCFVANVWSEWSPFWFNISDSFWIVWSESGVLALATGSIVVGDQLWKSILPWTTTLFQKKTSLCVRHSSQRYTMV